MYRANQGPRNKGGRVTRNKGLPVAARKLLVQQANQQTDVLSLCSDLPMVHSIDEREFAVQHSTSANTEQDIKTWLLDLTRENVKELYIDSGWGWNDAEKGSELWHDKSQYLMVRNANTRDLVAFTHFRFDMDYGCHVLYCYELQVSSSMQSSGLGAWLMQLLHRIARSCNMGKVVLTVGRNNPRALKFYFELGYRVDETSPSTLKDVNSGSYLILSCGCKEKQQDDNKGSTSSKKEKRSKKGNSKQNNKENKNMNETNQQEKIENNNEES